MSMNRIVMHHAASGYTPSKEAMQHYHYMIDGDGEVVNGIHTPADNAPGRKLSPGTYAAHTLNLNSGAIGVSILAMGGALWSDPKHSTKYPVRSIQVDSMIRLVAKLAIDYSIQVDRRFILSHAEVQTTLNIKQREKWDFDYDPDYNNPTRNPVTIGDELRTEILARCGVAVPAPKPIGPIPTLRRGSTGVYVSKLQARLGVKIDGQFGPATEQAVIAFQRKNQLLRDGIVGQQTLIALFPQGLP